MADLLEKVVTGRCVANARCFVNSCLREPMDEPFLVSYLVFPDEDGVYPTFQDVMSKALEYLGPLQQGEVPPENRDAAVPKQPMAPGEGAPQRNMPDRKTRLLSAYQMLNPDNDAHWTADGKPRVAALSQLMGESVQQSDVKLALNGLTRPATPINTREQGGDTEE
jgi:hypothetical protein